MCSRFVCKGLLSYSKCEEGRVELDYKYNNDTPPVMLCTGGEWRYICARPYYSWYWPIWSLTEAETVCSQLGYKIAPVIEGHILTTNGNIVQSSMASFKTLFFCTGLEKRLIDCAHFEYYDNIHDCQLKDEDYRIYYEYSAAVCNTCKFHYCMCSMQCILVYTFKKIIYFMCKNTANPISCSAGDVKRLNDSTVLICAKGEWHTLCSDQNTWTTAQAKVACRQLGMNPNGTVCYLQHEFTPSIVIFKHIGASPNNVSSLQGYPMLNVIMHCGGNETSLLECSARKKNCTTNQTVAGLTCGGKLELSENVLLSVKV